MLDDDFNLDDLERGVRVPISIPLDDDGNFDRVCPNKDCRHEFKVLFDDWRDKVPDAAAYCPVCGKQSEPTTFNTPDLDRYIEEVGMAFAMGIVDRSMEQMARDFNRSQSRGGFISMSMDYRPGVKPVPIPSSAAEQMRQQFTCEKCSCKYASIGAAFFCPACGHNSAQSTFDQTLSIVRRNIDSLDHVEAAVLAGQGKDAARDFVREMLEGQLGRLVGAFQRLAEAIFDQLPGRSSIKVRRNAFQNLQESSDLWEQAGKPRYENVLSAKNYARLNTLFQRRHVLEHREGIVDQQYVDRSGDIAYKPGERILVSKTDIGDTADLIELLAIELRK